MGFLDFLKKKDVSATSMPAAPSAPGAAAVSKFDDRLEPLKPLTLPLPPSGIGPGAAFNQPPPLPPAPKPLSFPSRPELPSMPKVNPLPPPPMRMEKPMPPKPVMPAMQTPKPLAKPEAPKTFSPISLEGSRLKDSLVSRPQVKVSMPQVTPPISGKDLPSVPVNVLPPSKPVQAVQPEQAIPTDEDIRKVLADLEESPVSFVGHVPETVVTESHEAYIPVANFDEALGYIQETSTAISHVQHLNEKLGHLETQTKTTIESIGKTFEGIHASLLALDEKLFQQK